MSRGESASGPITAIDLSDATSSGSRSPSLRSRTADRSAAVRAETRCCGVGEHVLGAVLIDIRVVEQPQSQLGFEHASHAGVEIRLARSARLDGIGQVCVCGVR